MRQQLSCSHAAWLTLVGGTHAYFVKLFYHNWGGWSSVFLEIMWGSGPFSGQIDMLKRGVTVAFAYPDAG